MSSLCGTCNNMGGPGTGCKAGAKPPLGAKVVKCKLYDRATVDNVPGGIRPLGYREERDL